jgi:hypothetical protein
MELTLKIDENLNINFVESRILTETDREQEQLERILAGIAEQFKKSE